MCGSTSTSKRTIVIDNSSATNAHALTDVWKYVRHRLLPIGVNMGKFNVPANALQASPSLILE
jgi:hypothetical protein